MVWKVALRRNTPIMFWEAAEEEVVGFQKSSWALHKFCKKLGVFCKKLRKGKGKKQKKLKKLKKIKLPALEKLKKLKKMFAWLIGRGIHFFVGRGIQSSGRN